MPSGLTSTSSSLIGASRISATSLGNGALDRPWKLRDQSTCGSFGSVADSGASGRVSTMALLLAIVRLVSGGGVAAVERDDVLVLLAGLAV
jgi:hypothetical protein